jgi:hypothetical protein
MLRLLLIACALFPVQTKPLPDAESFRQELPRLIRVFNNSHLALFGAQMDQTPGLFGRLSKDDALNQYSYIEKHTSTDLDAKRKDPEETNVFQVIRGPEQWQLYRKHISKNGVPLSAKELEKQDNEQGRHDDKERDKRKRGQEQEAKEDARAREKRKQKEADEAREAAKWDQEWDQEIRSMYDIRAARGEDIEGRRTILLTLTTKKDYKPSEKGWGLVLSLFMLKGTVIQMWITEQDHEVLRAQAEAVDGPLNMNLGLFGGQVGLGRITWDKGTKVSFERRKINDEVWLPIKTTWDIYGKYKTLVFVHSSGHGRFVTEYSDFKKYNVDTILKFPDEPPRP